MLILAVLVPGMVPALVGRVCRHLYPVSVATLADPTEVWWCPTCGARWADALPADPQRCRCAHPAVAVVDANGPDQCGGER